MRVEFSYQYINLLLIILGLIVIIFMISKKIVRKRILTFGNFEVLEKVTGKKILPLDIIPLILRILALILIVISISNPKIIYERYVSNTNFVIAIDTSSSMLTPDFFPNRLEVAKDVCLEFIKQLKNTKIGIVTFSGKAYVKTELTDDISKLNFIISDITLESPGGTAIGEALITSSSLFSDIHIAKNKTIILITDGRNNMGISVNESLMPLKMNGIKVFTIGIGKNVTIENVTMPEKLGKKNATVAIFPTLDEETLTYISNQTGGKYFRVEDTSSFEDAMRATLEKKRITKNPTLYLLMATCILLLLEWSLEITKYRILP